MSETVVNYHLQRFDQLKTDRALFDSQWEEAALRLVPAHRSTFVGAGSGPQGAKNTEHMYDAQPALAAQRFASVIESLSTPQHAQWHKLVPVDKMLKRNKRVRMWYDDINDLLFSYRYRPAANFVANAQMVYQSSGVYGNGQIFVDAPDDKPGLRYRNVHLGDVWFAENHSGVVDTFYRILRLTARQAIQQFGAAALPDDIAAAATVPSRASETFEFIHCVYPNSDYSPEKIGPGGMKWASLYIAKEKKAIVRAGGYRSFPLPLTRYTQFTGEQYGRGPAQWVLPSIKVLNEQKKTLLKQGHRVVDPVLLAFDDGVIDGFSLKPGALNKGGVSKDGRALVQTLPTGNISAGDKMMEMERQIINDAFLITLFQILVDTPQMTATEVLERAREKGMLVAPTAGRMQAEFLGPLIERELDLLIQQKLIPPPPPIIAQAGGAYQIEYDNQMSRMQRSEKAAGFMRALGTASEYSRATGDMTPLDWFDTDVAFPQIIDIQGAPAEWVRDQAQVAEIRGQRAQQQQQQQMIEAAPAVTGLLKAAPDLAKAQA